MKFLIVALLAATLPSSQASHALAKATTRAKVFLLENARGRQWCAYNNELTWKAAVRSVEAMTVGALTYSNGNLSGINVTETDQSGDWIVYDRYSLDDRGEIVELMRVINVLPGDRHVVETYSISNGKAKKISAEEKSLTTGKPLASPQPVWLPNPPIEAEVKQFPFSGLLMNPDLRTASKTCERTSEHQVRGRPRW